jgi:hypothetical protein
MDFFSPHGTAAILAAGLFAVELDEFCGVLRQEKPSLEAVVHAVVVLYKVLHVAVRTVVRKVPAVVHAGGAVEVLVI